MTTTNHQPRLSVGPISYYWPRAQVDAFYTDLIDGPVDIVYLGETICSKRNQLRHEDWLDWAARLRDAGKQVVLSTLALIEAESELKRLRAICDNGDYLVEANDIGAVNLLAGRPFVVGHSVNVYNEHTLALLATEGCQRWVLPVELTHETCAAMQSRRPPGVETEVFAYGRLPLAYSARCFTARARNLPKDDCRDACIEHPDGLVLDTQDDNRFLALNGIQTQSARTINLLADLPRLGAMGVDVLRISPQSAHTPQIIDLFHCALTGEIDPEAASDRLTALMPSGPCDGYWYGAAGMDWLGRASASNA